MDVRGLLCGRGEWGGDGLAMVSLCGDGWKLEPPKITFWIDSVLLLLPLT
jgi:hypothetical protein